MLDDALHGPINENIFIYIHAISSACLNYSFMMATDIRNDAITSSADVADDSVASPNEKEENDNQDPPLDLVESPGEDNSDDQSAANDGENQTNVIPT